MAINFLKKTILFPLLAFTLFIFLIELFSFLVFINVDNFHVKRVQDSSIKNFGWGEVTAHPYFGFIFTPKYNIFDNPWFQDPQISKKSFNIAILGGSVAAQFGDNFSHDVLTKRFKETIPSLKNKTLKFFNLAQGAHKQPQAFHIFMYYLEGIDMAINIEGWNEILPRSYHFDKKNKTTTTISDALPAFTEFLYDSSAKEITEIGEIRFFTRIQNFLLKSPSYSLKLTGLALNKWLTHTYFKTINRLVAYNLSQNNLEFQRNKISSRVQRWGKYSEAQHFISQTKKIKSYTFIQPNHHVPSSKKPHPKEHKMEQATSYIQEAYTQMEEQAKKLQKKGFRVYSLKNIFRDNSDFIYQDLEHLTPQGYSIMLNKILEQIQKDFK